MLNRNNKYWILFICLAMDLVGMISYIIPGIGESLDIVWAPIATYVMYKLFGDRIEGKIGAVITLFEELSLGFDFVPSFTITWIFIYLIKSKKNQISI